MGGSKQKMSSKLRQICVQAPEIVMSGDIRITAAMAVATKAKLESVVVNGGCECIEPPNSNSQPITTIESTGGGQQIQTTTYSQPQTTITSTGGGQSYQLGSRR